MLIGRISIRFYDVTEVAHLQLLLRIAFSLSIDSEIE